MPGPSPGRLPNLEFCENGVKTLAHEATHRRVGREFFARHTLSQLRAQSHYWLEQQGRLIEPLRYNRHSDRYEPIGWEEAFSLIGRHLLGLDHPDEAVLYTSGRTSNEAAFLFTADSADPSSQALRSYRETQCIHALEPLIIPTIVPTRQGIE